MAGAARISLAQLFSSAFRTVSLLATVLSAALVGTSCGASSPAAGAKAPQPGYFESGPKPGEDAPLVAADPLNRWLNDLHELFHGRWVGGFLQSAHTMLPPKAALNRPSLEATTLIVLTANGSLIDLKLERTSGNVQFDGAALELVRDASPFPPPPAAALSGDDRVYLYWRFARDARQDSPTGARVEFRNLNLSADLRRQIDLGRPLTILSRFERRLARMGDAVDLELLQAALEFATWQVGEVARSGEGEAKREAVYALGRGRVSAELPGLVRLLGDSDPLLVAAAAVAVGQIAAVQSTDQSVAMQALLAALRRADGIASRGAAEGLFHLTGGDEATWKIAYSLLAVREPSQLVHALKTVSPLITTAREPALITFFSRSFPRDVRIAALSALAAVPLGARREVATAPQKRDAKVERELTRLLSDRDSCVAAAAAAKANWSQAVQVQRERTLKKLLTALLRESEPCAASRMLELKNALSAQQLATSFIDEFLADQNSELAMQIKEQLGARASSNLEKESLRTLYQSGHIREALSTWVAAQKNPTPNVWQMSAALLEASPLRINRSADSRDKVAHKP